MSSRLHIKRTSPSEAQLTTVQYEAILTTLQTGGSTDQAIALLITLMAQLGLRRNEALSLSLANLIAAKGRWATDIIYPWNHQPLTAEITEDLLQSVRQYCESCSRRNDEPIFHLDPHRLSRHFHNACRANHISGICIHSFRHYFITSHYNV